MTSKYAKKVRKLLRQIYPLPQVIKKEVSLGKFAKDIKLSKHLQDAIKIYDARLGRMKVDFWVKHQIAVEVHGEQHEQKIRFSNDIEDLDVELKRRKGLDHIKQEVLNEAAVPFIVIWYYEIESLTAKQLKNKIQVAQHEALQVSRPSQVAQRNKYKYKNVKKVSFRTSSFRKDKTQFLPSKNRVQGRPLVSRPFRKYDGKSQLSKNWQRQKEQRRK